MVLRDAAGKACMADPTTGMPALTSDQLQVVILDTNFPIDVDALLPSGRAVEVCRKRLAVQGRDGVQGRRRGVCATALRAQEQVLDLGSFKAAHIQVG
jgi:hypothetical protein